MNYSLITVRYAKALYELSVEEGVQDAVKADMEIISAAIRESEGFLNFLESPLIKSSDKIRIMGEIFKDNINELTLKFIRLLFGQKREVHLSGICRNFIRQYKEKLGIQEATITTAKSLSSEYINQINDYLANKFKVKIELSEKVDPAIIGGFILRIEDLQINASIQSHLKKIKRELVNSYKIR
jgi:F-type H+-transporting ATPase subunit delta